MRTLPNPLPAAGVAFPKPGRHAALSSEWPARRLIFASLAALALALSAAGATDAANPESALGDAPRQWSLSLR